MTILYSLIADLHIFVYGSAECATISLESTKVKLLMLNNLEHQYRTKILIKQLQIDVNTPPCGLLLLRMNAAEIFYFFP